MQLQITPADIQRAREILEARAPLFEQTQELPSKIIFAVAQGIAEGRQQGIKRGVEMTTASNDA